MGTKRLVIETTNTTKANLDKALTRQRKTLTDWFNDKVEEITVEYKTKFYSNESTDTISLDELADNALVLKRLNSQDWSFTNDDTTYLSHNLHPYPAKYIPQIPNKLIRFLSLRGERIWDPFGGSGTTALEALLLGRQAISSDINPISEIIGRAKSASLVKQEEDEIIQMIEKLRVISASKENIGAKLKDSARLIKSYIPAIANLDKWFHQQTANELAFLRWMIEEKLKFDGSKNVSKAVLSKIVLKVSFQDSETRYVSKAREVVEGEALKLFALELDNAVKKIRKTSELLQFQKAEFRTANLVTEKFIPDNSIDLIVTSPPYPNATDYHLYHRFRIFWLGFDPKEMSKNEIGSHLRHQKEGTSIESYLSEMKECLRKMYGGLRPGRIAALVLGDSIFEKKLFKTAELLEEVAKDIGFESVGIIQRPLHETKRSFSVAKRLKEEKILVLRKPSHKLELNLLKPPFKLWDYENELRKREIDLIFGNDGIQTDKKYEKIKIPWFKADKLKRLTFTHGFSGPKFHNESTWQAILENGDAFNKKSSRKDPKYVAHGIHPYKGKFYPQLAKSLFNLANLSYGDTILDPFCGSGTVLLEGNLNGFHTVGFDINPIALKIAKVKTEILKINPTTIDHVLSDFIANMTNLNANKSNKAFFAEGVIEELESWFPEPVLCKLGWILNSVRDVPDPTIAEFIEVCLSSIIREVSHQEPKDLRIRRRKILLNDAPVKELFLKKLIDQKDRVLKYFAKANKSTASHQTASVNNLDCREPGSFKAAGLINSIDCVVTSPPYATALPYIDTDRLSILLLFGLKSKKRSDLERNLIGAREITNSERAQQEVKILAGDFDEIFSKTAVKTIKDIFKTYSDGDVGFRRKNMAALLYRYFSDMTRVLSNLDKAVKKNGNLFFVIGDNKTYHEEKALVIKSGKVLEEVGRELGWRLNEVIPITVTQENRLHNKNGIRDNDIIWFTKV
jgi:DNA modification methylase